MRGGSQARNVRSLKFGEALVLPDSQGDSAGDDCDKGPEDHCNFGVGLMRVSGWEGQLCDEQRDRESHSRHEGHRDNVLDRDVVS